MNLKYETIESNVITLPTQESHARKALRLLVIEDSSQDYELLHAFLSDSGYELRGRRVETESELRAALQEGEWDLIVSDDNLPCFSAESALRVVRSLDPNMPFIIVSGSIQEEKAIAAMLAGADDYISKRRMGRLVPAVDRSLRTADARRRRHAAEIALRDNEHRLRALAANIPGMLFELRARRDGIRFTYISEGSLALLGLAPAALLDAPETLLERFEQQDRERLLACLSASAPASVIRWEGRAFPAGGGSPRWVQVGASASEQDLMGTVWAGMMTDITEQKLTEAQLARSRDELRAQSAHAARARESERARIAREIHDEIGGTLTGLRADLVWLKRRLGGDEAIREKLEYMDELVDTAASTSVRLVRDLRPAVLDFGFVSALQWLARDFRKHAGIACAFVCNVEETELDRERATAIFRIFQELLTNVTKHARASAVAARLEVGESDVVLEVRDDGIGIVIPSRRRNDAYGIRGMRERAQELGGTLEINSGEHGGTVAVMRAPRHAPA